jgi:hypothetical protein
MGTLLTSLILGLPIYYYLKYTYTKLKYVDKITKFDTVQNKKSRKVNFNLNRILTQIPGYKPPNKGLSNVFAKKV